MSEIERVVAAIPAGKENAIHLPDLSKQLQIHPKAVKRYINRARNQGEPILSDNTGYWVSESRKETAAFTRMMRRQALSRLKAIRPMIKRLKETDEQIGLFDELTRADKM